MSWGDRKQIDRELTDIVRSREPHRESGECELAKQRRMASKRFYSVARGSRRFVQGWVKERAKDKRVLDYGCGNGANAILAAQNGASAVGIDISPVSIKNCREDATAASVQQRTSFLVMDAESLTFDNDYFDIICASGVLHHLDIGNAYSELARVLKTDGELICVEPLAYNPVIQLYRKLTPHLRTPWEMGHILRKKDLDLAMRYFHKVEMRFFHLATLTAIPFCRLRGFGIVLTILEKVDALLLRLPMVRWFAWQVVLVLSQPVKNSKPAPPGASNNKQMLKRLFDISLSSLGLLILSPLFIFVAVLIKWRSKGSAFYKCERVGRDGKLFKMYKFRTMYGDADKTHGRHSCADNDCRITQVGKFLRKYKLNELPQLVNVLKGDMSFVGPRPEVKYYTEMFTEQEKAILSVRPGITDWASIWNSDEGKVLAEASVNGEDPEKYYAENIRPHKIKLQLDYVENGSFWVDIRILFETLKVLLNHTKRP